MDKKFFIIFTLAALVLTFNPLLEAKDAKMEEMCWPRFRGHNGQGISDATIIPLQWTETDVNWKIPIPGNGHSSPVVWGEKVFVTSADTDKMTGFIYAVNASSGALEWQKPFPIDTYSKHADNSYASSTPVLDKERIYLLWMTDSLSTLTALTHQGKQVWRSIFPGTNSKHGTGTSPVLAGENVVFAIEQEQSSSPSLWFAVNRHTGKTVWSLPRNGDSRCSFSTPCLVPQKNAGVGLLFTSEAHGFSLIHPETGTEIWELGVMDHRCLTSPVLAGDILVATCKNKLFAVNQIKEGTHATPAIAGGRMFYRTYSSLVSLGGSL
ncbi:PQQ-binding-like beta-propeller repeat protein [candidate division KSB1 bacterium]|nr:PQQ-binding-like beta-propeller repeat protein [candidate division KSB1 bacterium]